jgi:hypothetical protein
VKNSQNQRLEVRGWRFARSETGDEGGISAARVL